MTLSPTPNMNLQKAEPSVTPGPDWAQMLNVIIDALDAHDHSSAKGVRITPSGLDINSDLSFSGNDAVSLRSSRYNEQTAVLADPADVRAIYSKDGNLYWNNAAGAPVQITSGTSVVTSISNAFSTTTPGAYPYTISAADAQKVVLIDTSAARTVNLPAATTVVMFILKDIIGSSGTNAITVVPNGANTIDGVNANRSLSDPYGAWMFISDGVSGWAVMSMPERTDPVGSIQMFGAATAPAGWLLCDGAAVSRTTYGRLFAIVGVTFGIGDGATTFNLPDMRQRFPIGKAASGTGSTLGGSGGNIDHTHSVPAHFHGMGTGSDFNITSGGAHTHSIDHDHGSVASGNESAGHTHSIDHDHGSVSSSSNGNHSHFIAADALSSATLTNSNVLADSYDATNDFSYDLKGQAGGAAIGLTDTTGAHTHSVDLPNFTGTSGGVSASHTHNVDLPNFTGTSGSTAHTHVTGTMAGRVGLVTGGVDGNAAMTSGTGNPPFLAVNFIIKT